MLNKLNSDNQDSEENSERKRSNSQRKYQKAPDIITQVKPNSFIQPPNPHQSAFTPTNRSNKLNSQKLLLPPKPHNSTKKTLILDLDETLVHSSFTPFEKNDIVLNVDFEGVMYNIYVLVRPDAELFIKTVAKFYELVIFTASISKYASPLLDILDKEKNIKYRLYRDQCTFINGIYIKDLKKCNRSLKDLIIVDNSPIAYTFDSDNGLPIKTWLEDPDDKELMKLVPILEFLSKTKDVRKFIDQFVYNNKILYEEAMEIIKIKELMDLTNKNNLNSNNDLDEKFTHNLKMINKEEFNLEENSSIKEEKEKELEKEKETKKKELNLNIDNALEKDNFINNEIPIKERNEDINLNTFNGKGFNTAKNCIKFSNDLNFQENNINIKENNANINNTNINININNNKINIGKQNNLKQNKKNIFRFKASEQQPLNKKGTNNKLYNNQFDPSLPLTLLLSNISKGLFTPKACSQDKKAKEKSKNKIKKKTEKANMNNMNNIKPFLLKDMVSEKTSTNKKIKYVNLLDKFKGSNKNINPLMKTATNGFINNVNKKIRGNYSMKNIINKPSNIRVSSSINSYQGYAPGNTNKQKEKIGTSYCKVTKSKSTENFFVYNTSKNYPKTPKEAYRQKFVKNSKKIINFMDSFNSTKIATNNINKNINYSKNSYGNLLKMKKNKTIKK